MTEANSPNPGECPHLVRSLRVATGWTDDAPSSPPWPHLKIVCSDCGESWAYVPQNQLAAANQRAAEAESRAVDGWKLQRDKLEAAETREAKLRGKAALADEIAASAKSIKREFMETTTYVLSLASEDWLARYDTLAAEAKEEGK